MRIDGIAVKRRGFAGVGRYPNARKSFTSPLHIANTHANHIFQKFALLVLRLRCKFFHSHPLRKQTNVNPNLSNLEISNHQHITYLNTYLGCRNFWILHSNIRRRGSQHTHEEHIWFSKRGIVTIPASHIAPTIRKPQITTSNWSFFLSTMILVIMHEGSYVMLV